MPVRGIEKDFLSSNEDIALKILMQQCKKHESNDETKALINKSINKLRTNGHAIPFSELTEPQQMKIRSKKVQHFVPWRVVFNKNN